MQTAIIIILSILLVYYYASYKEYKWWYKYYRDVVEKQDLRYYQMLAKLTRKIYKKK